MAPCTATGKWDGKELPSDSSPLPDCTELGRSEDWEYGPARVCPQRDEAESPDCEKGTITNVTWHIGELTKSLTTPPKPQRCNHVVGSSHDVFLRVPEGEGNCVPIDAAYHLAHGDIRVNDPRDLKVVVVRIKASKTDPF